MLVLELLALGASMATVVVSSKWTPSIAFVLTLYQCNIGGMVGFWFEIIPLAGTAAASLTLLANFTMVIMTICNRVRIKSASVEQPVQSADAKVKSLEDERWSKDGRPQSFEDLYTRRSRAGPSRTSNMAPSPEIAIPIASDDIALQPLPPRDIATHSLPHSHSDHTDTDSREVDADSRSTGPALSLSDVSRWSITSGTLTGAPSCRSTAPSYKT